MSTKLPPDPDGQNDDRSGWADQAIIAFMDVTGTDAEDALSDLLADLMHWGDRQEDEFDFESQLARAKQHYDAETLPDGGFPVVF